MHAERRQMKVRSGFAAATVFAMSLIVAAQAKAASVGTDGVDYAAGDVVHISGSGWTPGEVVELTIAQSPAFHSPDTLYTVAEYAIADETGEFSTWYVV